MSNQQTSSDDSIFLFFGVIVLIIVFLYFSIPLFKEFYLTLKLWQMEVIARVVPISANTEILQALKTKPSYDWTFEELAIMSYKIQYYLVGIPIIVVYWSVNYIKKNLFLFKKYSKIYNVDSLLEQEKKVWKYLEPISQQNLLKEDIKNGKWASAKKPQEIAIEFKLLDNPKDYNTLNREKAKKYFARQLGELFTGMDNLTPIQKALCGCFFAHYLGNPRAARYAFLDMAGSYAKGSKPDYSTGIALFEKYKNEKSVQNIMNGHRYVSTAMMSMFEKAKERGIIISKYFLWLKIEDRILYYALNNVGREVAWVECAGIFDHFQHEKNLGKPMAKMYVDEAVIGLEKALKKMKYYEPEE